MGWKKAADVFGDIDGNLFFPSRYRLSGRTRYFTLLMGMSNSPTWFEGSDSIPPATAVTK